MKITKQKTFHEHYKMTSEVILYLMKNLRSHDVSILRTFYKNLAKIPKDKTFKINK